MVAGARCCPITAHQLPGSRVNRKCCQVIKSQGLAPLTYFPQQGSTPWRFYKLPKSATSWGTKCSHTWAIWHMIHIQSTSMPSCASCHVIFLTTVELSSRLSKVLCEHKSVFSLPHPSCCTCSFERLPVNLPETLVRETKTKEKAIHYIPKSIALTHPAGRVPLL